MTFLVYLFFSIIIVLTALFSGVAFYHINKYSYIGDASKRVFILYVLGCVVVVVLAIIFLIINRIVG